MTTHPFYQSLDSLGKRVGRQLPVTLSPELVGLLSEQLYRSPSKAIEELVVNGFDAEADEARIYVPHTPAVESYIVVYDDGLGMTYEGLADLWKVGRPKTRSQTIYARKQRKQIGKFGIGKLSTYAVANRVTYVTKSNGKHLAVTIDYRQFVSKPNATTTQVLLPVRQISLADLWNDLRFRDAVKSVGLDNTLLASSDSWTFVILEELKPKAKTMGLGRLRWVLRTAMPLSASFSLFLNGDKVESSKEDHTILVEFKVSELPLSRLESISKKTGYQWKVDDEKIVSEQFPEGIHGDVSVTLQTLEGKSSEIVRSEGFFVYVHGRLVNEEDARFGLHELSHATLNRFRANVYADDLDKVVTANRESMEDVQLYRDAQVVLNEIFSEARSRYEEHNRQAGLKSLGAREEKRVWVPERLVEYPTADALTMYKQDFIGPEPDESWMYLNVDPDTNIAELTQSLYSASGRKQPYTYQYTSRGRAERLVEFNPADSTFVVNQDHELVVAYSGEPAVQGLLQDVVTSEALLEVYLREAGVSPHVIGEVLERRDLLLRGLADSHLFSLDSLSNYIRDSASNRHDLEIAVVAGARALGFVTKHIGGSRQPDGIARFADFPYGEQKITLEAKSSVDAPSAKDIDFAGISVNMERHEVDRCLLVAPGYQGSEASNAALSARQLKISCWTIGQFADIIRAAESRQISARQVLRIVRQSFAPEDVEQAVAELLASPTWERRALYRAIAVALRNVHGILASSPRSITMIATEVARMTGFEDVQEGAIRQAVSDLAGASQGALLVRPDNVIVLNVDYDELDRRIQSLTGEPGSPRRLGAFGEATES